MRVLAVSGLKREAKIVAGGDVLTLAGGGDTRALAARILALLSPDVGGLISIGIAGALDPSLQVGDIIVADAVAGGPDGETDEAWSDRLAAALPEARRGVVAGVDRMVVHARGKAGLRRATGALSVDMESHIVAEVAVARGLPFAVVRVISDGADRAIPDAAQAGMKPDGGTNLPAVLLALAADPRQLPALIRTGKEAEAAFRALAGIRGRLGPTLGLADV